MPFFVFVLGIKRPHICSVRSKNLQKYNLVKGANNIRKEIKRLAASLLTLLFCMFCSFTNAQGWVENYGGLTTDEGFSVSQTRDEGFIVAAAFNGNSEIRLLKTDPNGKVLWENSYGDLLANEEVHKVIETLDGGYVAVGACTGCGTGGGGKDVFVFKTDDKGAQQWSNTFFVTANGDDIGYDIVQSQNGDFYIVGSTSVNDDADKNIYIIRLDGQGDEIWTKVYGSEFDDEAFSLVETPNGNFALAGYTEIVGTLEAPYILRFNTSGDSLSSATFPNAIVNSRAESIIRSRNNFGVESDLVITGTVSEGGEDQYIFLMKINALNNQDWSRNFFTNNLGVIGKSIVQTQDNGYVITGTTEISTAESSAILIKRDSDGNAVWDVEIGKPGIPGTITIGTGEQVALTNDGGFIVVGSRSKINFFDTDVQLIKTNAIGRVYSHYIQGNIFKDDNLNCDLDGSEAKFEEWTLVAKGQGGEKTFFGSSDEFGNYSILVDTGSYVLDVVTPNAYWLSCTENLTLNLFNTFDTTVVDFAIQPFGQCPSLQVDIATPYLEACTNATYQVSYQNHGNITAADAFVEITLDEGLTFIDASITPTSIVGNALSFDLGNIGIEQKGNFEIEVEVDCDAVIGEAHCVEAHIFPDEICGTFSNWDESSVRVEGVCEDNLVKFKIENQGDGDMGETLDYIIIEDIVMSPANNGDYSLLSGDSLWIELQANGSTYRIITPQVSGHPGNSRPTVAIEGCTEDGSSQFSTGFFTQFPEDDKDLFLASDCQENLLIASLGPNFKRGYPKGYGDSLKVASTTDLSYNINFLNTGIDTAIRVVIRDTISNHLDPATVQLGSSSHEFDFEVYGNGILKFTFEDINLPPGGGTESRGFVKYRISQKPDNPVGTAIKNSAAAYFDFQRPLKTDTTCHHVGGMDWDDFVIVSTDEIFLPGVNKINVYPNPFIHSATIEIESDKVLKEVRMLLFDQNGKMVKQIDTSDMNINLYRGELPAGFYVYRIESEGVPVSVGKIIIQ